VTVRIFVYGTLRRGERAHRLLAAARFAGEALTAPRYALVDLGPYPALVASGDQSVRGELYDVDEPTLARLDAYEGSPELYARVPIELADGGTAESYVMPRAAAPLIASGDWKRR
jgi:gamma-glutamylaminecyclotransferase